MISECYLCPQKATQVLERFGTEPFLIPVCEYCARGKGDPLPAFRHRMYVIMQTLAEGGTMGTEELLYHAGVGSTRGSTWMSLKLCTRAGFIATRTAGRKNLRYLTPWGWTFYQSLRERPFYI